MEVAQLEATRAGATQYLSLISVLTIKENYETRGHRGVNQILTLALTNTHFQMLLQKHCAFRRIVKT